MTRQVSQILSITTLLVMLVCIGGKQTLSPAPAPAAAILPVWIAPAIDLIKYLVDKFKPNKDQKKEMDSKTSAMQSGVKTLEPYPKFLSNSRAFRNDAIDLAQTIQVGSRSDVIADKVWPAFVVQFDQTSKSFENTFKPDAVQILVTANADLQAAENDCTSALRSIEGEVKTVAKDASGKDKQAAFSRMLSVSNALTTGAQTPEFNMVQNTQAFVSGYSQLATDLQKGSTPKQPTSARRESITPKLLSVSFRADTPAKLSTSASTAYLTTMQMEIQQPVKLPAWSQVLIESNQPQTSNISLVLAAAIGLVLGVFFSSTAKYLGIRLPGGN
jgi:hypothetical protein